MTPYRFLSLQGETSTDVRAYLTVWRLPSAPVLLLSGFAGRLPSAMVPLALLLMVQQQTGSYAIAGLASATLGIASALMALTPIILLPISYYYFHEKMGLRTIFGTILAVAGTAVIFLYD